jgi:hypothetical protein
MTMKLELTPEVRAGLLSQVQQNGLSLEAFAEKVLRKTRASKAYENENADSYAQAIAPPGYIREASQPFAGRLSLTPSAWAVLGKRSRVRSWSACRRGCNWRIR